MPRKGYLQIKVSASEHDTLRRLAAESQVTVSDWVRGAIRAKTALGLGQATGPESALETIRLKLKAPDFEYLQLLFVPGNPARSLELWCRTKAQIETKRQEWYLWHARQIAELQVRTQTSPKIP